MGFIIIITFFLHVRNGVSERINNFPMVSLLLSDRAGIQIKVCLTLLYHATLKEFNLMFQLFIQLRSLSSLVLLIGKK